MCFVLNDKENITIKLDNESIVNVCCIQIPIVFADNTKEIILTEDSLKMNLNWLASMLHSVLANKLPLHSSLIKDIGYLFNEETNDINTQELAYEKVESIDWWVGRRYKLWSYMVATWLYNDVQGNIMLEITPIYPKTFTDPDEEFDEHDYQIWMQNYQPLLKRIISKEVAQEWFVQAQNILKLIEKNKIKKSKIQDIQD